MRIGIDARMYGPEQAGLGRYVQQLILHLEQIDADNEFVIFLRKENWDEYQPANPRFKKILADTPWYGWQEQLLLPPILAGAKIDLMHFPHWNVPLLYRGPFVVTIHDLLLLHYPTRSASALGPISYFFKNLAFRTVLKNAARRAKHIIAVSEFTKKDIMETLKIPLEKISVTYPAPIQNNIKHKESEAKNQQTLKKYNLKIPYTLYILYVGVAYPHKNLDGLLRAWKIFNEEYSGDYQLVLVGKKNYFYEKLISDFDLRAMRLPRPDLVGARNDSVTFTGFIPDPDLPALYANASLYVFPSLYEGFGLPPLEAMTYDIPVASSNRTCLPEVLQDAAYYFNPEAPDEIAQSIYHLLTDKNLRQKLIAHGRRVLANYSWHKLARQTAQIYRQCG